MKATEKELKCIDLSLNIRKNLLEQKLKELYKNKTPILISPKGFVKHFWQDFYVTKKMMTPFKAIIYSIIFFLIYIIALPFVFVFGLIDRFFTTNKKQRIEYNNKYLIDYEVSDLKSFEILWDTKGLRDWGVGYYHLQFTEDNKLDCLKYWCKILYNIEDGHFNEIVEGLRKSISISRQKFYEENPNGHISMASPIQLLPTEIQTKFGNYIP